MICPAGADAINFPCQGNPDGRGPFPLLQPGVFSPADDPFNLQCCGVAHRPPHPCARRGGGVRRLAHTQRRCPGGPPGTCSFSAAFFTCPEKRLGTCLTRSAATTTTWVDTFHPAPEPSDKPHAPPATSNPVRPDPIRSTSKRRSTAIESVDAAVPCTHPLLSLLVALLCFARNGFTQNF